MAPQLRPFPNRSPLRQRENLLYLRKLWNKDACRVAGISKTVFYRWLQSEKFRELCQSLKEPPSHDESRYLPRDVCRVAGISQSTFCHWLQVGETAESGRFLEFLETLKRPGRSSMSRGSRQRILQPPAATNQCLCTGHRRATPVRHCSSRHRCRCACLNESGATCPDGTVLNGSPDAGWRTGRAALSQRSCSVPSLRLTAIACCQ